MANQASHTIHREESQPLGHECEVIHACSCAAIGLDEINPRCPVHGHGDWTIRCGTCGRFMPITYASRTDDW